MKYKQTKVKAAVKLYRNKDPTQQLVREFKEHTSIKGQKLLIKEAQSYATSLRPDEYHIFVGRWWAEEPIANLFIGVPVFYHSPDQKNNHQRQKTFQFLAIIEIRSATSYIWVGKTCFIYFLSYIYYRTDNCMMSNIKMPL